jgi:hypothetical protein
MFGSQDQSSEQNGNGNDGTDAPTSTDQISGVSSPTSSAPTVNPSLNSDDVSLSQDDQPRDVLSPAGGYPQAPSLKIDSSGSTSAPIDPTPTPSLDIPDSDSQPSTDLTTIKQQALDELSPLIDELDQSPEERFRTLMMMIQASDNRDLIPKAFETAHRITDEKFKAQALLDIVNEINYFTQRQPSI